MSWPSRSNLAWNVGVIALTLLLLALFVFAVDLGARTLLDLI